MPHAAARKGGDEGDLVGVLDHLEDRRLGEHRVQRDQHGEDLRTVAAGEVVSDENFKEQLETLNEELETLNAKARELEETIANNVAEILEA